MRTDASLVIFEPHPLNLFRLTSTLHRLANSQPQLNLAERVVVFPLAVGNVSMSAPLYVAKGNLGDSVIGRPVRKEGRQKVHHVPLAHWVPVRPLDALLLLGALPPGAARTSEGRPMAQRRPLPPGFFRMMKLDVQGFGACSLHIELDRTPRAGLTALRSRYMTPPNLTRQTQI